MSRTGNRRRLAIVASLLMVVFSGAAALFLVQGVNQQLDDVIRAYEVRKDARDLTLALTDAETGQRGFLLTLNDKYLEPYRDSLATIDARIASLLDDTVDNPEQHTRISNVLGKIDAKREELARTIALATANRLEDARSILRNDAGNLLMSEIRDAIAVFIATEDEGLVARNGEVNQLRQGLVIAIIAALAGSAVLAYTLFTRTQRQVSELAQTRSLLLTENEELDERVKLRTAELEEARAHADRERSRVEAVLQDTNHRIGNSLATVSSLLGLQLMRTKSDEVRTALEAARDRVHAIASGHRRLRLGDDLETTRADDFLVAVLEDIQATRTGTTPVTFAHDCQPLEIMARDATTLGIILGELVTNALKHAFPDGRGGTITARLRRDADGVALMSVEDDGAGISPTALEHESGLGSLIIKQLARQFSGEAIYSAREGGGTLVTVRLPGLTDTP